MKAVRETAHEGKGNKPRDSGELTEEEQLEQRMIHMKENAIIKPFICMLTLCLLYDAFMLYLKNKI